MFVRYPTRFKQLLNSIIVYRTIPWFQVDGVNQESIFVPTLTIGSAKTVVRNLLLQESWQIIWKKIMGKTLHTKKSDAIVVTKYSIHHISWNHTTKEYMKVVKTTNVTFVQNSFLTNKLLIVIRDMFMKKSKGKEIIFVTSVAFGV